LDAGLESLRAWLQISNDGQPTLQCFKKQSVDDTVPNLRREISRYHFKRVAGVVTDKPVAKDNHTVDNCRYLAAYGCPYIKPREQVRRTNYVNRIMKDKRTRERSKNGESFMNLGPRISK
jgi:hypothetical protein